MSNKRLYRATQGSMVAGVCKGIAEYFSIDVTIIRILWVIFSFTSMGVILYIACIFIIPDKATVEREKRQMNRDSVFEAQDYKVKDKEEKKTDQDYTIY